MLCEDGNESFQTTKNCTMNHDRPGIVVDGLLSFIWPVRGLSSVVLKLEPLWELEVELNRGTLEVTLKCVGDRNVNLRKMSALRFQLFG